MCELGYFQANGKKQTLFQFTKKVISNSLKLQTSLFSISGKVFFKENNLLSQHQSGFILGDSCFQQLITITHETYKAFGCSASPEVRGVFLDTVFSRIEAAASICFLYFLVRFVFEGGFYSRAASIYRSSLSVIRQMALFRNIFSRVGL